ncbi:hypothetical protein EDC96DRAFT_541250 [Choanephora cucurbitarum]|nr:hypothetical protein EDC96DRAFT_541250 [Choanephora cucurbitarum]
MIAIEKLKHLAYAFGLTALIACRYWKMLTVVLSVIIQTMAAKVNWYIGTHICIGCIVTYKDLGLQYLSSLIHISICNNEFIVLDKHKTYYHLIAPAVVVINYMDDTFVYVICYSRDIFTVTTDEFAR